MAHLNGFCELHTESGTRVPRPDNAVLAEHIAALASPKNTYLAVQQCDDADWYVLIGLPDPQTADPYDGIYLVQFQDDDGEHWSIHRNDPVEIAREVLNWMAPRLQQ